MSRAELADTGTEMGGASAPARHVPLIVGTNLRRLRKTQGHSLERLAELSGVSRAMLGQIETAKSVPTVSLLWRIADALGVPVATLVATENEPTAVVVSRANSAVLVASDGRYVRRSLVSESNRRVGFFELTIAAGHHERFPPAAIGTCHSLVVALGRLKISIGAETPLVLDEGDALTFEASGSHVIENPTEQQATAYLVVWTPGV